MKGYLKSIPARVLLAVLGLFLSVNVYAQNVIIGTVVDETDEPLIGVSVIEKGTTKGAVTDLDGQFRLDVANGTTLVVSYVGYDTKEVKAANGMTIKLQPNANVLDEVVAVGYGVMKKSVVTASIAKVDANDLANQAPVRLDNALKGLAAGVNVTSSSGQPGEAPRVRVRGTGTINNSDPLYIVDGMPIGGGLDFVNPNDIESIEVLKDAAAGAIYGARAANGVILVATKKGKQGKAQINYNFSYGWQTAAKKRDVTNATDYAILQNERLINGGQAPTYADPYNLTDSNGDPIVGGGWDWQDMVFYDNAPVMNHDLSISGATEKVNYYLSLGYFTQDGIVGGNYGQSNYDRLTLRSNNIYNVMDETKNRDFLNKLDLTVNVAYLRTHSTGVSTNSEFGSILGSALYMAPTVAPVATGKVAQDLIDAFPQYDLYRDANGNPYTIVGRVGTYQEMNNPLAIMQQHPTRNWSHKFVPNFAAELQLWDTIKYRFSYSGKGQYGKAV